MSGRCYFADVGPCDHVVDRAHLIEKQVMRIKHLPDEVIWDERCWVPMCRAHHHKFDHHFLSLTRSEIPLDTERFAHEHGLTAYLDRRYGPLVVRCRAQSTPECQQLSEQTADSIYGEAGMPADKTYEAQTMTVVCEACR